MSWFFLTFLGYGQLLVLDESLSVQLVSSWYQWIYTVCIVLSENKYEIRNKPMRLVMAFFATLLWIPTLLLSWSDKTAGRNSQLQTRVYCHSNIATSITGHRPIVTVTTLISGPGKADVYRLGL